MSNKSKTKTKQRKEARSRRAVLCRFNEEDLAYMRETTGADADATAVGIYVRKSIGKERRDAK